MPLQSQRPPGRQPKAHFCLYPCPKELMLRNHVKVHALWAPEADETLIAFLITSLQLRHAGPHKKVLLKG
jgi:hypothetical protein